MRDPHPGDHCVPHQHERGANGVERLEAGRNLLGDHMGEGVRYFDCCQATIAERAILSKTSPASKFKFVWDIMIKIICCRG